VMKNDILAVFDLDFTVWDCGGTWCDQTDPPYKKMGDKLVDGKGRIIRLYENIPPIFEKLISKNIKIASASRTGEPVWAENILKLFGIHDCFSYHEIYPGSKLAHFKNLQSRSGIDYGNMIFFDDEYRNITEIKSLGVETVHVTDANRHEMEFVIGKWIERKLSTCSTFNL
jgi:magnesium-dependent phosphatase 1